MTVKVVPLSFDGCGFFECPENDAILFGVYYHGNEEGYGRGVFPAFDHQMKYQYKTRAEADAKAQEYIKRKETT